jgi:glycosyltransferase involved in cell wall biosynthesis
MTLVSIVIPCFNDGRYLPETLASIASVTHDELEVIVVDDGSTDPETLELLAGLDPGRVLVARQDNAGPSAARNLGVSLSSGDYILPLDADDLVAPGFVGEAARVLDTSPDVGIVGAWTDLFGGHEERIVPRVPAPVDWLFDNHLPATSLFRRADFDEVGGYPPTLRWGEDWVLWVRLVARGRDVVVLPRVGLHYRRRPGQVTARVSWPVQELARAEVLRSGAALRQAHEAEFVAKTAARLNQLEAFRLRYRTLERLRGRGRAAVGAVRARAARYL